MKAYVVMYEIPFDVSNVIGLAATLKAAKKIVKKHKKERENAYNKVIDLLCPSDDVNDCIWIETTNDDDCAYYIEAWEVKE